MKQFNVPTTYRSPLIAAIKKQRKEADKLKKDFAGFTCWIITSSAEGFKNIGLRPTRKITLYNGSLECKYLKYEMYEGSKKDQYLNKEDLKSGN